MLEAWAIGLTVAALVVVVLNAALMVLLIDALKDHDLQMQALQKPVDGMAHTEVHAQLDQKSEWIKNKLRILDDAYLRIDGDLAKLKGAVMALGGIEARLRDALRKRWKALGLVKPKKSKAVKK